MSNFISGYYYEKKRFNTLYSIQTNVRRNNGSYWIPYGCVTRNALKTHEGLFGLLFGVLRRFQQFFSHITADSSPTYMFLGFLTLVLHTQLAAFPNRLIVHWWKTNDACHNDFCWTSERMLAELGFELSTPGLTARVATDWTTLYDGNRMFVPHKPFEIRRF